MNNPSRPTGYSLEEMDQVFGGVGKAAEDQARMVSIQRRLGLNKHLGSGASDHDIDAEKASVDHSEEKHRVSSE